MIQERLSNDLKKIRDTFAETHSRKHIRKRICRNTFVFLILSPKIKQKSFESPIPLTNMVKCKTSNKKIQILKLKTSGGLKSDYELKIQKQYLHLGFM